MRKLIRYSVAAFLTWAVVTFAWASLSHVTGVVGPAKASEASLHWVADAVTLLDPPGVLGAPQRFAAGQIHGAAHTAGNVHRVPERLAADFVDRLGHDAMHRGGRHRHRHEHRHEIELGFGPDILVLPFDELDGASERARERAIIELERHRERAARTQERADRIRERARRQAERTRDRARRNADRALAQTLELRLDGSVVELDDLRFEWEPFFGPDASLERELAEATASLEAELDALAEQYAEATSSDRKDDLKRKIMEKIEELIERLRRELEDSDIELSAVLDDLKIEVDSRIHIRER